MLMAAQGLDNDEIAERLDTRREIVSKWRKRFFESGLAGLDERPRGGRPPVFPPEVVVAVKALACELPCRLGVPLSRLHVPDIASEVIGRGIVAEISGTTIWRWLSEDAIRPWRQRSWIFPRDPDFEIKAGRVLDLYARYWDGKTLGKHDYVISADEKTSIQARIRCHPTPRTRLDPHDARRARIRTWRCPRLLRRLGRASRQGLRTLRADHRHRALRPPRQPGHERRALRLSADACTGSSTTAPATAANAPSTDSNNAGPTPASCNSRSTPPG